MCRRGWRWMILEVIVLAYLGATSLAQNSNTGSINGYVYERTSNQTPRKKIPIKNAIVWVVRDDRLFSRDAITNEDGSYQISALPPGKYVLKANCGPDRQCDPYDSSKDNILIPVRAVMKNIVADTVIYLTVKKKVGQQELPPIVVPGSQHCFGNRFCRSGQCIGHAKWG